MHKNIEFERFVLKGLGEEWRTTASFYGADSQPGFKCPVFSLNDSTSFLGLWDYSKYEISIQRKLAFDEPWEKVRHVLKHEMAHQYADTVLKQKNEPPHGKSFKKACEILRVPKKAGFDLLNDKTDSSNLNPQVSKIRKLFSLSQSANAHEAELAMKKAHDFMEKYNFDKKDIKKEEYFSVFLGKPGLRHFKENYYLAGLLSRFYFVYPVWVPCFVKEKGKTGKIMEISGKFSNVEIASYVYDYLNSYIDRVWADFNKSKGLNRYKKSDFAVGIIHGFSEKLKQNIENFSRRSEKNLPVAVLSDPDLKKYLGWYYPNLSSRSRKRTIRKDIYEKGVKKGRELRISKAVSRKDSNGKGLIAR
ncbi:MAG: DUF2786 domain-containing protein [Desulforegulaceae bacterium]|nr:DUF2786 domain-containing protein [Desulforegulaceae bacterium]